MSDTYLLYTQLTIDLFAYVTVVAVTVAVAEEEETVAEVEEEGKLTKSHMIK